MSSQVACVQCRQQKVRCIGRDAKNDRCERCQKRNLECIVDNNFKRTVKRKAVESLEAEIEQLKAQLATAQARNSQTIKEEADGALPKRIKPQPVLPRLSAARFDPPRVTPLSTGAITVPVTTWYCSPKTSQSPHYESLTLDSPTIELLFREYVLRYHRVLPVVEVQRGPEFVYGASHALFWTIMAIASRRRSADLPKGIDFQRLCDAQKQHLSEIAVSPVLGHGKSSEFNLPSLYAVQAFILCTLWPPPTASINADMSWNTIGIAVLTAIRAGLHCPGYAKDFERIFKSNQNHRANMGERLITWLATNALSQAVANMFGYPSAANFRAHHEYLFHNLDLPLRVRHMYEIQRNAHDIEQSLGLLGQGSGSALDASMATSLIRLHAARYDQIEAEFGPQMDTWTLFTLHAGRAQLFSYYLFGDIQEESMLLLYNSCLTLLNHVVVQPDEYMKCLPVVSILILWQTASVVAKLYFSKWSTNLDKVTGERLYRGVIKKVSLSSVFEHDLPYRAAEIMTQMWGTFRAMRKDNHERLISAKLTLKSRMSASAFFDSLWLMREGTEIRSQAPTTLSKRTPDGHNQGINLRLVDENIDSLQTSESSRDQTPNTANNSVTSLSQLSSGPPTGTAGIPSPSISSAGVTPSGIPRSNFGTPNSQGNGAQLASMHGPLVISPEIPPSLLPGAHSQRAPLVQPSLPPQQALPQQQQQPLAQQQPLPTHHLPHHGAVPQAPFVSQGPQSPYNNMQPQRTFPARQGQPWANGALPPLSALLSPDPHAAVNSHKSVDSPVSPALSAMIDASWSDMDPEAASTIWRDVNAVMEDFGFGLSELPYISP